MKTKSGMTYELATTKNANIARLDAFFKSL